MKHFRVSIIDGLNDGDHEYQCADGMVISFDERQGTAQNVRYWGYIDSITSHVDITDIVRANPALDRKYLVELRDHVESWGTDEDERVVDHARDIRHG